MKRFFALIDLNDLELTVATDDQTFLDHLRDRGPCMVASLTLDIEDSEKMQLRKAADERGFYQVAWHKYVDQFFKGEDS